MAIDPSPSGVARRGAIAVVPRGEQFLVIRRSANVLAPGMLCFPGGGIEGDESEAEALVREFHEELGAVIRPLRCMWRSTTRWRVELAWWLGEIDADATLVPNPLEVESVHWLAVDAMLAHPRLLDSNRAFLAALAAGEISFLS